MDAPFYRSYRNVPSGPRQAPRVREIPVHYVGSVKPVDRSGSAIKIQKVFRGFLVRKSMKKIVEVRSQVEEIEKRITEKETIDLIRSDSRERLRINEMLMTLLFKLDSVRGVDSGVRDCRKAVIKKTISLQGVVDAVVSGNADDAVNIVENIVEAVGQTVKECTEKDIGNRDGSGQDNAKAVDDEEIGNHQTDDVDRAVVENCNAMPLVSDRLEESVGTNQTESQSDSSGNPQSLIEECEEDDNSSWKQENDAVETHTAEDKEVAGKENRSLGTGEENTRNRELLEKMMEENEKMMDLMAQLFERNERQTRLLSSLSQRVEKLEKAFVCDRLRRKKKRYAGIVDSCETSPDNKNCGKR